MTKAMDTLSKSIELEKKLLTLKNIDPKTRRQISNFFKDARELIRYQIPNAPFIDHSDGREFMCKRCGTRFETEEGSTYKEFYVCGVCGQMFYDTENLLKEINEAWEAYYEQNIESE